MKVSDEIRGCRGKGFDLHPKKAVGTLNQSDGSDAGVCAVSRHADLSKCGTYRYSLWREWGSKRSAYVAFVGLNPSTADAMDDDPTIRRCMGFAALWGYSSMCMINLFAFRATKPADLKKAVDPIGADNNDFVRKLAGKASLVVSCWGNHGALLARHLEVGRILGETQCLGTTALGHPRHPLYVPYSAKLTPYKPGC